MQHGREHPWNIRRVSHRHLHDQRNLLDLKLLAQSWAGEPSPVTPADRDFSLEDDTWPEDVLTRFELEVRELQLRLLGERLKDAPLLAERSYQAGQESASRRWMQADPSQGSIAPADKRALLLVLFHSPLGGRLGPGAFLIRRSLITEVSLELLQCPHRLGPPAAAEAGAGPAGWIDELCRQQFHWLRGYFSFLNPAITPLLTHPRGRCVVSW